MSRQTRQLLINHGSTKAAWKRTHEALKANQEIWSVLKVDGFQSNGLGGLLESRRCPVCRSSLSRLCTALEAVEVLSQLAGLHARSLEAISEAAAQAQGLEPPAPQNC